jgi:tRNA nucleotidyltransferase (CCA-adding enzyme)
MKTLLQILEEFQSFGAKGFIVGGWVRDMILGIPSKDIDVEVFNIELSQLIQLLQKYSETKLCGKSFGVVKCVIDEMNIDFSIPRREYKVRPGHHGFNIECDPKMDLRNASLRRDFTINAMFFDPINDELIDFHDGRKHIQQKLLVATSNKFGEDPLRVFRAFQFSARFGFEVEEKTVQICKNLIPELSTLSVNRIRTEWMKWAEKSVVPGLGLKFLHEIGILNTTSETKERCDNFGIRHTNVDRPSVLFAILCEDMDDPTTFMKSIGLAVNMQEKVLKLIQYKNENPFLDKELKKFAMDIHPATIQEWILVRETKGLSDRDRFLKLRSSDLGIFSSQPKAIIQGKHLIEMGMTPGTHFTPILEAALNAQINEIFNDIESGKQWVENQNFPKKGSFNYESLKNENRQSMVDLIKSFNVELNLMNRKVIVDDERRQLIRTLIEAMTTFQRMTKHGL